MGQVYCRREKLLKSLLSYDKIMKDILMVSDSDRTVNPFLSLEVPRMRHGGLYDSEEAMVTMLIPITRKGYM